MPAARRGGRAGFALLHTERRGGDQVDLRTARPVAGAHTYHHLMPRLARSRARRLPDIKISVQKLRLCSTLRCPLAPCTAAPQRPVRPPCLHTFSRLRHMVFVRLWGLVKLSNIRATLALPGEKIWRKHETKQSVARALAYHAKRCGSGGDGGNPTGA